MSGILSLQTSNCAAHSLYVVAAATSGLYRYCLRYRRVRDVDWLVLREIAHGIGTGWKPATEIQQQSLAQWCVAIHPSDRDVGIQIRQRAALLDSLGDVSG